MAASDSKILGIMLSALLFLYTFYECVGVGKEKNRHKNNTILGTKCYILER